MGVTQQLEPLESCSQCEKKEVMGMNFSKGKEVSKRRILDETQLTNILNSIRDRQHSVKGRTTYAFKTPPYKGDACWGPYSMSPKQVSNRRRLSTGLNSSP